MKLLTTFLLCAALHAEIRLPPNGWVDLYVRMVVTDAPVATVKWNLAIPKSFPEPLATPMTGAALRCTKRSASCTLVGNFPVGYAGFITTHRIVAPSKLGLYSISISSASIAEGQATVGPATVTIRVQQ